MDYQEIRNPKGKTYQLRFLPYLDTQDIVGYDPTRGYGYGRWEEFFHTLVDARNRMSFLIQAGAIEDIELRKAVLGQGYITTLIDEWKVPSNNG